MSTHEYRYNPVRVTLSLPLDVDLSDIDWISLEQSTFADSTGDARSLKARCKCDVISNLGGRVGQDEKSALSKMARHRNERNCDAGTNQSRLVHIPSGIGTSLC